MEKKTCDGCFEKFDEDVMTNVTNSDSSVALLCPRCVFLIAMYLEDGIKREFIRGSLHPDVINSRYRKILKNEFYVDAHATYKKYLSRMINRQETKRRIIHVPEKVIKNLAEFPFVFMNPGDDRKYNLEPGVEVTLTAGDLKENRRVYGFNTIDGKYLKKYGRTAKSLVLFLPA